MADETTTPTTTPEAASTASTAPTAPTAPAASGNNKAALQAAQARISELEGQVKEWAPKVGQYDSLQSQFEQARQEWTQKESGWGTERALLGAGINDPEAVEVVSMFYGRLTVEQGAEKPSLSDWLTNKDTLPKAVLAYLPSTTPTPAPNANKNTTTVVAPNPNKGATGNAAPGGGSFNAQSLSTMGPEAYKANRDAILASLGKR